MYAGLAPDASSRLSHGPVKAQRENRFVCLFAMFTARPANATILTYASRSGGTLLSLRQQP